MKIELDLKRRGTIAELCRREAAQLRVLVAGRTMSDTTKEIQDHAAYLEATADDLVSRFDAEKSAATLIDKTPNIDIIAPATNGKP